MKNLLAVLLSASLLTGCASQGPVTKYAGDAATVAGAGAVGYYASDKNVPVAAGSAVVALGVKRFMDSKAEKQRVAELDEAYKRGMAQAAKTADAAIQNAQKDGFPETSPTAQQAETQEVIRLPITAPARVINGVRINPSQEVITLPSS